MRGFLASIGLGSSAQVATRHGRGGISWSVWWPAACLILVLASCTGGRSRVAGVPQQIVGQAPEVPPSVPILEPHQIPSPGFAAHGTAGISIRGDREAWISGTLVDESGVPIEGVRVQAAYTGLHERDYRLGALFGASECSTGALGEFALEAPPTPYSLADLCASKPGFVDFALGGVPFVKGANLNLGVRTMMRGVPREFEVVHADGSPAEGVGVARMRVAMSLAVEQRPVWLGATDHRGRLRADVIPAEDRVAWFSTFVSAIVPGQLFADFPGQGNGDSPPTLRLELPQRRWIEGRLEGLLPGVEYGVRSLPGWKSMWGLANFPEDHPIRGSWGEVVPTRGAVRVPTLIDGGEAYPMLGVYARHGDDWVLVGAWRVSFDESGQMTNPGSWKVHPTLSFQQPGPGLRYEPLTVRIWSGAGDRPVFEERVQPGADNRAVLWLPEELDQGAPARVEIVDPVRGTAQLQFPGGLPPQPLDLGPIRYAELGPLDVLCVDSETGHRVPGARLSRWFEPGGYGARRHVWTQTADPEGMIRLAPHARVQMGGEFLAEAPGYASTWQDLRVDAAQRSARVTVELDRSVRLAVEVVDEMGAPAQALVVATEYFGPAAVTGVNGLGEVQLGPDEVEEAPNFAVYRLQDLVPDEEWTRAPFTLGVAGPWNLARTDIGAIRYTLPRAAPFWIQILRNGEPLTDVAMIGEDESGELPDPDDWIPSYRSRNGKPIRVDLATFDAHRLLVMDIESGTRHVVTAWHPGPDQTLEVELGPNRSE